METLEKTPNYELMKALGPANNRTPEKQGDVILPVDTLVVSADNHHSVSEDIWYERFPAHLRDRAPRVWFQNSTYHIGFAGKTVFPEVLEKIFATYDVIPGMSRLPERMADLAVEGIDKEIVFGNNVMTVFLHPDLELREWIYRVYNEYLADLARVYPDKFYGVALMNYWDLKNISNNVSLIKSMGFKTLMIPIRPGKGIDGRELAYASEEMDPFWTAIEESGLPLCFHVGENFFEGRGGIGTSNLVNFNPFRHALGQLIFGGIFDRHPGLQIAFVEAGINWVEGALQDAEMIYGVHYTMLEPPIKHPPRYYWHKHCYATFMTDALGLRLLDEVGADRVMWSSDYPHAESTLGYGWTAMQAVVKAAGNERARNILGLTAMKLFNLN